MAGVFASSGPVLAQSETPSTLRLYEKFDVLGVLDCEVRKDIHLLVDTDSFLRCDYTPKEGVDVLKRYSGYVKAVDEGFSFNEGDFVCWTALRLRGDDSLIDWADPIKGVYLRGEPAVIADYELKDNSLIGGANNAFVLEPRCVAAERAGRNIADVITSFDLSR